MSGSEPIRASALSASSSAGADARKDQGFDIPRVHLRKEEFQGDPARISSMCDEIIAMLDSLPKSDEALSKRLATLRTAAGRLLASDVGASNISRFESRHKDESRKFFRALFGIADEMAFSGARREALILLARFAVAGEEEVVAYDQDRVAGLMQLAKPACSYGVRGLSWAGQQMNRLAEGLQDDEAACYGLPQTSICSETREFEYLLQIGKNESGGLTFSGGDLVFDNIDVDVSCAESMRDRYHLVAGKDGKFAPLTVPACAGGAPTSIKWRANAPAFCQVGVGRVIIDPKKEKSRSVHKSDPGRSLPKGGAAVMDAMRLDGRTGKLQVVLVLDKTRSMDETIVRMRSFASEIVSFGREQVIDDGKEFEIGLWSFANDRIDRNVSLKGGLAADEQVSRLTAGFDEVYRDVTGGVESIWEALARVMKNESFDRKPGVRRKIIAFTDDWGDITSGYDPVAVAKMAQEMSIDIEIRGLAGTVYLLAEQAVKGIISPVEFDRACRVVKDEKDGVFSVVVGESAFSSILAKLDDGVRMKIALAALYQFEHSNMERGDVALKILGAVVAGLYGELLRSSYARRVVDILKHGYGNTTKDALDALGNIVPTLADESERLKLAKDIARYRNDSSCTTREAAGRALAKIVPTLTKSAFEFYRDIPSIISHNCTAS